MGCRIVNGQMRRVLPVTGETQPVTLREPAAVLYDICMADSNADFLAIDHRTGALYEDLRISSL